MTTVSKIVLFLKRIARRGIKISFFWPLMVILALCSCLFAWLFVNYLADEERQRMLISMHDRAESLFWALESGARFCHGHRGALSELFVEMAMQPGIAWIALVGQDGRIILDSNPELSGQYLYTRGEMAALASENEARGRFSPDDPDIYETWKAFNPGRLRGHKGMGAMRQQDRSYIFVGMNAMDFMRSINNYVRHIRLIAGLVIAASLGLIGLLFYAYKLGISRRQLADERAFSTLVIKSYPSPMLAVDSNMRINIANAAAEKLFGLGKKGHTNLLKLNNYDWAGVAQELAEKRTIIEHKAEITDSMGEHVPVSMTAATIYDTAGKTSGFLFVFKNLAEINYLKNKLKQSERLSSLGRLASGLAHEIRNPLSSLCGYANYLESKLQSDPMAAGAARLLVEEAQRVNGVLTELLTLAKPPVLNPTAQPLSEILDKTRLLALPDAQARNINLDFQRPREELAETWPKVDKDRLIQAILNLLLNAIQAVPAGGKVAIDLQYSKLAANSREKSFYSMYGPFWRIQIRDNGPGMNEEIKKQLFTPYFTTKANGSGLGLPITREIVESHDGVIYVNSLPGQGAVFTILLPAGARK